MSIWNFLNHWNLSRIYWWLGFSEGRDTNLGVLHARLIEYAWELFNCDGSGAAKWLVEREKIWNERELCFEILYFEPPAMVLLTNHRRFWIYGKILPPLHSEWGTNTYIQIFEERRAIYICLSSICGMEWFSRSIPLKKYVTGVKTIRKFIDLEILIENKSLWH